MVDPLSIVGAVAVAIYSVHKTMIFIESIKEASEASRNEPLQRPESY